jgi:UDP-N-acetylglucosamine transferase subunit ALG13
MIFVTAGTQLPFDRLVKVIDDMAANLNDLEFVVQALPGSYKAKNIEVLSSMSSNTFDNYIDNCELIISHAGMGTIITALVKKKPIIVMPRLFKYKEHRNDHQLGSAKKMDDLGYIYVAYDNEMLVSVFTEMWPNKLNVRKSIANEASKEFIASLDEFIKY